MDKALFDRIVNALMPDMHDPDYRKARIETALYGFAILAQIEWLGGQDVFTARLVRTLDRYGELQPGVFAVSYFLDKWKFHVGTNRQDEFDALIEHSKEFQMRAETSSDGALPQPLPPPSASPRISDHIFISYAHADRAWVERLAGDLRARGYIVWIDFSGLPGGDIWRQSISDGIHDSAVVLLILSPDSVRSRWVGIEVAAAVEAGKKLIPLRVRPFNDADEAAYRDMHIDHIQYRDFTKDYKAALDEMLFNLSPSLDGNKRPQPEYEYTGIRAQPETASELGELRQERADLPVSSNPLVTFTLFSPSKAHKYTRYSLVIHAHKPEEQGTVRQDARKFSDELGDEPKERHSAEPIPLAPKTQLKIVPEAEGITFDPPELTKIWDEKWLRFNFDFEVPDNYPDEEILLRISVQVKGFEVACIKSSCEVVAETVATAAPTLPDDPLVDPPKEGGTCKADANLYRNVFLSYSRKDEEIAWRRVREIESMLGDRVFMDLKDLRAGEDWESRLFEAIDQADILHLLWSENSAASKACRSEWMYALEKKCGDTRCFGVIRPVYWKEPMPAPPDELKHLHFQRIKLEDEG